MIHLGLCVISGSGYFEFVDFIVVVSESALISHQTSIDESKLLEFDLASLHIVLNCLPFFLSYFSIFCPYSMLFYFFSTNSAKQPGSTYTSFLA